MKYYSCLIFFLICSLVTNHPSLAQKGTDGSLLPEIKEVVRAMMKEGNIPGLSLVIIKDQEQIIENFGYADIQKRTAVNERTLFEIGSCSKAFTALAIAILEQQGKIKPDQTVADHIPWFMTTYKGQPARITVRDLLHHTSGIPWSTISKIPRSDADDALEETVKQLIGQELNDVPGKKFEYATINYDVLALIVQIVSGQPFETFVQENIIRPLHMHHTAMGYPVDSGMKATGYKIGFFEPRVFEAPVFKGNNAAGYVISNAEDMAKWLKFQMGYSFPEMYRLAKSTQQRDETVPPHANASYAMGWDVSLKGDGEIFHSGTNPNYTAYVAFRPARKIGIVVLANSNSSFTPVIANSVMKILAGEEMGKEYDPGDWNDRAFSMASIVLALYNLVVLSFLVYVIINIRRGKRTYEGCSKRKLKQASLLMLIFVPVIYGIYILPQAMYDFSWDAIIVWTPVSFLALLILIGSSLFFSFTVYLLVMLYPEKNRFKSLIPGVLLLSIISGMANMIVVVLITSSLNSKVEVRYLVFYCLLALMIYLSSRRFIQISLIKVTNDAIYQLREQIIKRIFSTSYQKFEQMDRGRVYTTLNDDAGTIGESTNMFVGLATSFFTAVGAFLYLASIASWATALAISLILVLVGIYYVVCRRMNRFYVESRDSKNVFMRLINGIIDGFKELSLHHRKKKEYMEDVFESANNYRVKMSTANIRFVNTSIFGEAILIMILGSVAFAFPVLFPGIKTYTLMSFLIVLLYLIGPVNTILGSIPSVMRLRISWNRMQGFLKDIPSNNPLAINNYPAVPATLDSIVLEDIQFNYRDKKGNNVFSVGPINLEVRKGEILFIIGANGSGKTTLAKLITGLYEPDGGRVRINNKEVDASRLGEYFSVVFSPIYLFRQLYSIDVEANRPKIEKYLKVLNLEKKVTLQEKHYSTIDLSGGQRKRLALLQCYMEDAPIFLFDEWAADQDPSYRNFFYRTILPEMKRMNKIVIAITHDDHYFDVADRVLKMENGKLEAYHHAFADPLL